MDLEVLLKQGIAHHEAGALAEAATVYKAVLDADPRNVDALYLMSVLATVAGDPAFGAQLARAAVEIAPDYFAPYVSLGNALQACGHPEQAVDIFGAAIELNPGSAEALSNLSSALHDVGRYDEAMSAAARALSINPAMNGARNNLGNALLALGSPDEAVECYDHVLQADPEDAAAWFNRGNAASALGQFDDAVTSFRRSIELADDARKHFNLANAFYAQADLEQAAISYCDAIEREPASVDARVNLSTVLKEMDRLDDAEGILREALAVSADDPDVHFNLALILLQQGRLEEGWQEYEWRWSQPAFVASNPVPGQPRWDGAPLPDATLVIRAEQGFGDAILAARFVPEVARRVGRVILECRPELARLFAGLGGVAQVVPMGEALPPSTFQIPMMSLPDVLGEGAQVAELPYLAAAHAFDDVAQADGRKIGMVWAGSPTRRDSLQRACRAENFLPLLSLPNARFYSLQVGAAAEDVERLVAAGAVDLGARFADFADTAAAIAQLDLVISVDTAVAHLAAAMGKPVWVLLSRPSNGWAWLSGDGRSLWYPTARVMRQSSQGDWAGLFAEVLGNLDKF
jgi:tetratricopeptide (TPR) repeat protein